VTPVELVCFHRAGGGSASFHPLRLPLAVLGANVALTTVKLPGGHFLFRQPDPQLVTAVARVAADVALERS
jgi:surfactin synthase thioesterase subunit